MILLSVTTDTLQIVTTSTSALDVHASYLDMSQADPPAVKGSSSGRTHVAIVTATTTAAVVPAPAASTTRNVKTINIRNKGSADNTVTVQFDQNGTDFELHKVTLKPGEALQYIEGVGWCILTVSSAATSLLKVLAADDAGGQNVSTAQPWFPTAGGVTVAADTTYFMDGLLMISRAAGATSHTTGQLFAGTATLTSIAYTARVNTGDVEANVAMQRAIARVATNFLIKGASTATTEQISIDLKGIVRVNAAGTFIPQFIYSAAPGGTPTIKANSFFRLIPLGAGAFTVQGTWA